MGKGRVRFGQLRCKGWVTEKYGTGKGGGEGADKGGLRNKY